MALGEKLKEDLKSALKSGDKFKVGVLRFLLSEIQSREKDKQASSRREAMADEKGVSPVLTDDEIIQTLQKEFKKRREAIVLFKKGGREDLIASEEAELGILEAYIPKQLTREEVLAIVEKVIAGGSTDFNMIMKESMKEMKGRADGKMVTEVIKERIGA